MKATDMPECYLCGIALDGKIERSDDDVPPKSLFGAGIEKVKLPCCRPCNAEYQLLDEHFKNKFSFLSLDVPERVREKAIRSMTPNPTDAEKINLMRRAKFFALGAEEIQHQGQRRLIIKFEPQDKLDKWLSRIIKGVYFERYGERMPDGVSFCSRPVYEFNPPKQLTDQFQNPKEEVFWSDKMTDEIQKVFNDQVETWMIVFYKTHFFLVDVKYQ
jgi:hypothetical protein